MELHQRSRKSSYSARTSFESVTVTTPLNYRTDIITVVLDHFGKILLLFIFVKIKFRAEEKKKGNNLQKSNEAISKYVILINAFNTFILLFVRYFNYGLAKKNITNNITFVYVTEVLNMF